MTLFEYISVAVSIVLSLSAAQLLNHIRSVFDPTRRYWVHGVWVIHLLMLHVIVWWAFWGVRDASWNLGSFSLVLSIPALIYVAANALVPSDRVGSLQEDFLANRTLFFTARGVLVLVYWAFGHLLLDAPLLIPGQLPAVIIVAICVVGIASSNHRVQATLAILGLVDVVAASYFRFAPGPISPQ